MGGQIHGPAQIVPAGKVAGHQHQRLVHGQEELAVTGDAPLVPQGLRKGPAQADADVLHAVVAVHLGVPLAADDQVKIPMPGEQLQHVLQEPHAGGDVRLPSAVQV